MRYSLKTLATVLIGIVGAVSVQAQEQNIIDVHLHALQLDMLPAHMDTMIGHEGPVRCSDRS